MFAPTGRSRVQHCHPPGVSLSDRTTGASALLSSVKVAVSLLNPRGIYSMRNTLRLSISSLALVSIAACSRSAEQPAIPDDLKKDLASVGGGDVQLAGSATPRLDIVSAGERTQSPTPTPKDANVPWAPG